MFNKVYIIDDDEISIFLTETLLEVENFARHFKGFLCAREALEELITNLEGEQYQDLPDILFLDLNMPFMSGWDLLDMLLPYEADLVERCRIFILTSSVDKVELQRAEKYRMVAGFLQKPLEDDALAKVRALL